ncbi:plant synaptotagmin [Reticulomyxa filosa]|uniref:Plant synaptotagmin n=1 Tax=Reticulomyxa filosa TaxID=46433 RepID=X6MZQ8_RETFI|nr:plant synaptotagmin [Reticulomyxa filosa]|eukprot:ETO19138.1 plant synaptotagmin [Reticulomyxa filosa]
MVQIKETVQYCKDLNPKNSEENKEQEYDRRMRRYRLLKKTIATLPYWRYRNGKLKVHVIKAINLEKVDRKAENDSYVKLSVGNQKYVTKIKKNSKDPQWNETFEFVVNDPVRELLIVKVRHKNTIGKDTLIGGVVLLTLTDIIDHNGEELNYKLTLIEKDDNHEGSYLVVDLFYKEE